VSDRLIVPFPFPKRSRYSLIGSILTFDHFGNAITNLPSSEIPFRACVVHRGRDLGPLKTHYAEAARGTRMAVAGSAGLVELSAREGDYASGARARRGDPVHVRFRP
jgi:S-adenosylmethionine hydrolase